MAVNTVSPAALPIVGQPMRVLMATLLPLVECRCERGGNVVIMAQIYGHGLQSVPAHCPSCGRVYVLRGLTFDAATQQLQYAIEISPAAPEGKDS